MNLAGLHRICGKGIHTHHIIDTYRLHMCHDHRWNAWKGCLQRVFCPNNEACHVFNRWLTSPQILSVRWNQLLTIFIRMLPQLNINVTGQIQSFKHLIAYLLGCRRRNLMFILLLLENIDLPMVRMYALRQHASKLSCHNSYSKCWQEGIFDRRFPIAFLDGRRKGLQSEYDLSSWWSL